MIPPSLGGSLFPVDLGGACPGGEAFRCAGVDRRAFEMLDLGIRPSPLSFSHRRARSPNCLLWHCCLGILSREAAALRRT